MPLLLETMLLCSVAYLAGLGLAWAIFGRRRDNPYA
jgi:hypothetical protein